MWDKGYGLKQIPILIDLQKKDMQINAYFISTKDPRINLRVNYTV